MESLEPLLLARAQFAANISFHILFPTITIALGWVLVFVKWRFNRSGDDSWMHMYRFWVRVFALTFALGVVSGVTMSFQFGTNWPGFMETVGNVAGPLLAYEVLTAFFLEATFLGIMLYGARRVSNRMHTVATWLVAIGTSLSAFWILVLNSWMHTPAGYELIDGVVHATDWWAILFNPSMPYRLTHMLLASGLTVAFLIAGLSAHQIGRGHYSRDTQRSLRTALILASVLIPLQVLVGDVHGLNTLEHQPAKIAAMEGIWEDEEGAALRVFAWPDEQRRVNHHEVAIPRLASLILTHDPDGLVRGLNSFDQHPPVAPLFFSFRLMVGMGMLMWLVSWWALFQTRSGKAPGLRLRRVLVGMTFSGWVATLAGWYTTEIGRQPWLVQGVLKTADAVSDVGGGMVLSTLIGYLTLYLLLIGAYISTLFYLSARAARGQTNHPDIPTLGSNPVGQAAVRAAASSRESS